jgi:hypothetical protein
VASVVAGRASSGIGAMDLGRLAKALGVLEEAGEHPHVIIVLLPWFVGGKGY